MSYGKEALKTLFSSPFDASRWADVLANLFGAKEDAEGAILKPQPIEHSFPDAKGWYLGSFTTSDGYLVGLFRFEARSVQRRRVGLRNLLRPMLGGNHDAALAVFTERGSDIWRFSFVCDLKEESTAAKRFTYVFGDPAAPYRTPVGRFLELQSSREAGRPVAFSAMKDAFSVEALSDEFFDEYKNHYETFVSYVTGKRFVKESGKWVETAVSAPHRTLYAVFGRDDKSVRDYVKKMLGRLVFLHFLQKKGWLGAAGSSWDGGDSAFLAHLFDKATPEQQGDFLDEVLEPLFFEALNTDRSDRGDLFDARVPGMSAVRIPYLNGGLFERDALDELRVRFPAGFFEKLLHFFADYNFTIDENDADEAEVGIDPEMLGRIFENLLEDNKDKGAFYTPKEIVRYMCRRSLLAYLSDGADADAAKAVETFVETHSPADLPKPLVRQVAQKLRGVKICDPAIGSGAFPMGLLRELFALRSALEPDAHPSELKRNIIENNIYGVDIEKGAVDIARLRFWLALVVDADEPVPLPNLDFKIMQGNSLVESWGGHDLSTLSGGGRSKTLPPLTLPGIPAPPMQLTFFDTAASQQQVALRVLLHEWFSCSDHSERSRLREEIMSVVGKIFKNMVADVTWKDIDFAANTDFFLWHLWFAEVFDNGGFDIVIGNPPYIKEYENRSAFDGFRETSPYYMGKMDLFHGFACHGIDLLKPNGLLCFIAQNNWTTNAGAKKMRNKVVSETRILELLDFNVWKVFNEAGIQTMIMLFQKCLLPPEYTFRQRVLSAEANKIDYLCMLGDSQSERVVETHPLLVRARFKDKLLTFSGNDSLLEKIARGKEYLSDEEATNGIHTHHDCVTSRINREYPSLPVGMGIFVLDANEVSALRLSQKERQLVKPFFGSGEIYRYFTYPQNQQWIIYTGSSFKNPSSMASFPHLKKHLDFVGEAITSDNRPYGLHRAREEHFFQGPKIVSLRKCPGRPCFSYSDFACYVPAMYYVIQTTRWDMKYLTGVFNSHLVAFWLRHRGKMQGENFQVDKEPLLGIPLPCATAAEQKRIARLVDRILTAKTRDPEADTTALESEIDTLVYRLYGLTPDEIATVEGNG